MYKPPCVNVGKLLLIIQNITIKTLVLI